MVLWGAVVKPGESYVLQLQGGGRHRLLRITKATLGNCDQSGWSMVEYSASDKKKSLMLCALNPNITAMCRLELEFKEDENVVLSVHGQSSIHLSGYYMRPHNDGQRHHRDNPTAQDAEFICLQNQKHHEILESRKCKPLQTEEALCGELIQQQDPDINGQDNGDHRFSNEWNNQDKDADIGHEKNGLRRGTSWNTKEVFKKLTESDDEDHEYDDLPIMIAFEKRRAAKNGGAKIHTEKRNCEIPGKVKFPSVKKYVMDQLNEQRGSKMINSHDKEVDIGHEKNGLPHDTSWNTKEVFEKLTGSEDKDHEYDDLPIMIAFEKRRAAKNGAKIQTEKESNTVPTKDDQITHEENIGQTACQVKYATQNEGHDGVTNQIIVQSGPPIKISDESRCFTAAAKEIVKKHDDKGKNKNRTQKLENGLKMKDITVGNVDSEIASSGDKVCVRYLSWLSTNEVINVAGSLINFEIGDGSVIRGLDIGVSGMRVGGKRKLTIPPLLGYGNKANGEIPANSYLFCEVDLLNVKRARTAKEAPANAC